MNNPLFTAASQMNPDDKAQVSQMAVVKLLSTPPEPLMELVERLEIPWQKQNIDGEDHLVIKWSDWRNGEKRNQAAGPFIKKVMEQLKAEVAESFPQK